MNVLHLSMYLGLWFLSVSHNFFTFLDVVVNGMILTYKYLLLMYIDTESFSSCIDFVCCDLKIHLFA
jgi:hypothetical protein